MPAATLTRGPARVRVEAEPAEPVSRLPRMDVAAFVGFAERGPLDVPVPVGDPAEYEALFGGDVMLAWDPERGEPVPAQMAPAVRAFFANGGRRAWVIRVADQETAQTATIPLPGVLARRPRRALSPATAFACSPGSWADELRVGAALRTTALAAHVDDDGRLRVRPGTVAAGDLLRLFMGAATVLAAVARTTLAPGGQAAVELDPNAVHLAPRDPLCVLAAEAAFSDRAGRATTGVTATRLVVSPDGASCSLAVPAAQAPQVGTFVSLRSAAIRERLWLVAASVVPGAGAVEVRGPAAWQIVRPRGALDLKRLVRVERLTLELSARRGAEVRTLTDLGLAPGHPRFLGDLPADADLFGERAAGAAADPAVWAAATTPRFPLAGNPGVRQDGEPPAALRPAVSGRAVLFPVCVGAVPAARTGPQPTGRSAASRDGLETFDPACFCDRALAATGVAALVAQADHLRYQAAEPRRLKGVHALMHIDEPALLALPDLVHRPWAPADPGPQPRTPVSDPPPELPDGFADCGLHRIDPAPELDTPAREPDGGLKLTWSPVPGEPDLVYTLEESATDWSAGHTVYRGASTDVVLYRDEDVRRVYRVRAEAGGSVSAWSETRVVSGRAVATAALSDAADYAPDALRAAQATALRVCAARGDLLAVLALPRHFVRADAAAHLAALREDLEPRTAGFAAVYHPWIAASGLDHSAFTAALAPDGAVLGTIAGRTTALGAWIAPANQPLAGVVATASAWDGPAPPGLNEIVARPVGHLCLTQDTLHEDAEERPINVRRLIALVRRLALREGERYVFEPNDPVLRRSIERGFDDLLRVLQGLGAFAGATPEEAFRVRVLASGDGDAGALIVELALAPSRPLRFLVVRLRHAGDGTSALEVAA